MGGVNGGSGGGIGGSGEAVERWGEIGGIMWRMLLLFALFVVYECF